MDLIFGTNNLKRILLILFPGLLTALLIAYFDKPDSYKDLLGLILATDIVSGLISNATAETQKAWLKVKNNYRYIFIIFHIFAYPALLLGFVESEILKITLILLLLVKTFIFIYGQRIKLTRL